MLHVVLGTTKLYYSVHLGNALRREPLEVVCIPKREYSELKRGYRIYETPSQLLVILKVGSITT